MTTLVEEYTGEKGQAQLLRSLKLTQLVDDSKVIAEALSKHVDLVTCTKGEVLIQQDATDDEIHLVLQGRVQVLVDGREVAIINSGGHVGELALIDPRAFRCASVVALRDTVTARITQEEFVETANRHPALWRRASQILGERLRRLNHHLRPPNPRPVVFLGCASRELGYELESRLRCESFLLKPFLAVAGSDGFPTRALSQAVRECDLGIIARGGNDANEPAGQEPATRDQLLYLCGACVGSIGPTRTIVIEPADEHAGTLSAQFGFPSIAFVAHPEEARRADLDLVGEKLHELVRDLGPKQH